MLTNNARNDGSIVTSTNALENPTIAQFHEQISTQFKLNLRVGRLRASYFIVSLIDLPPLWLQIASFYLFPTDAYLSTTSKTIPTTKIRPGSLQKVVDSVLCASRIQLDTGHTYLEDTFRLTSLWRIPSTPLVKVSASH